MSHAVEPEPEREPEPQPGRGLGPGPGSERARARARECDGGPALHIYLEQVQPDLEGLEEAVRKALAERVLLQRLEHISFLVEK